MDLENLTYEQFSKIPILDKKTLNSNMINMLTNKYCDFKQEKCKGIPYEEKRDYLETFGLELRVTSGSAGIPVEVIKSKDDIKRDYVTLNFRRRKLSSYNFKGKFVWVWPVNPIIRKFFYPDSEDSVFWKVNKYGMQYMLNEYSPQNFAIVNTYICGNGIKLVIILIVRLSAYIVQMKFNLWAERMCLMK